ncbi:MAG: helix-turn-helix domain-containing protein [Gammaproteobacteria bacterium]|nr:helix-turn-helix domain-containing protein [Gammaproteobacteria bacterium]
MPQGFIKVKKAAEILGVTPHYVRKLIRESKIHGHQIKNSNRWEVDRASLEQYKKTDIFKSDLIELAKPQMLTIRDAVENVEDAFDGDVITYIINQNSMIDTSDAFCLDNLLSTMLPRQKGGSRKKFKKIILVLHSQGGILEAAIKLVEIIKIYANEFEVIVPFIAKSAATIIALKADTLYLTPVSELGPVDPIVQSPTNPAIRVPAKSVQQFIDQYGTKLKETSKTPLDDMILSKLNITIDPYLLGAYTAAKEFAADELVKSLEKYKLTKDQLAEAKDLFLFRQSHNYPILFSKLKDFSIGKLIEEKLKLASIRSLMAILIEFMARHNIIKIIGNREQNNNTVIAPEQIKQKSVQTGN